MASKDKVTISVRLEPALAKRLKRLAKSADRSVSWYMARIMEDRIEIEESHVAAILKGEAAAAAGLGQDLDTVAETLTHNNGKKPRARKAG